MPDMVTPQDARSKVSGAYNAASDFYDHKATSFWDRFGRKTVERLHMRAGAQVLDVCCGAGASAIPAAEKVGPAGLVLGVDLAENLLELARAKARSRGLDNVEFRVGDLLELSFADGEFDSVVCVFGIFFAPDMPAAARTLWKLVRPGGQLAITTWGAGLFEPANTVFWESVREVRPDLYKGFNPWDRISDPEAVRSMLLEGGITAPEVVAEKGSQRLASPDDWWSIIMGTGFRGTIEQLAPPDRERVHEQNISYIRREAITEVETSVVYAVANKP
jgi:ubiquinone/menaquinone biosynthesis C-methylase UbiE